MNKYLFMVFIILGLIQLLLIMIINIIRFIYIIYILFFTNETEVRNSPLNKAATFISQTILCFKGICGVGIGIGSIGGTLMFADEIIKSSGRSPFFMPLVGQNMDKIFTNLGYHKMDNIEQLSREIHNLNDQILNSPLSAEVKNKIIINNSNILSEIKNSKILSEIKNIDKK
uniref:Orf171 n=1 Tax=Zancudomyces culisetae TaxID=1213189 RepID=Q3T4C3_ZANCU|nr:orf171 [Zancudomyces culisetae]AAW49491.1 orf171 [Zancudomyces culisetae]